MRGIVALALLLLLASSAYADMYPDASNAKLPEARRHLNAGAYVDIRDFGNAQTCNGAVDDLPTLQLADAAVAAGGGGSIGIPGYPKVCHLASGYTASLGVGLTGAEPVLAAYNNPGTDRRIGPHIQCATLNAPCITVGNAGVGTGGQLTNLIVSYAGTPTAGATAVTIQGYNSVCNNVAVYNAYDGFRFYSGLSSHCNNLYTAQIVHDHITQDGSPELYINGARFGINSSDVASNSFVTFTGNDPNGFLCNQCQFNLGGRSPSYLFQFRNLTSQINGIYQIANSVIDMSVGSPGCLALIKTDATAAVNRLQISNSIINAPNCPFIDQTTQARAPNALQLVDNTMVAVSALNLTAGNAVDNVFDIRGNKFTGNVLLDTGAANWHGVFSNNKVQGNLTIASTGGPWLLLSALGNRVVGTFTDTAATGLIYYSGPGRTWTPTVKLGATTVTVTSALGTATRQADNSIKYHIGFTVSNKNGGTGALTVTGAPYACQDNGRAGLGGAAYVGLTGAPQIGALTGGGGFSLNQYTATGSTALLDTNV